MSTKTAKTSLTLVDPLVDEPNACELLGGVHRSTLWRWIREGKLPKPIKLGPGVARWRMSHIRAFIEAMAANPHETPPGVVLAAELNRGKPSRNPTGKGGKKAFATKSAPKRKAG